MLLDTKCHTLTPLFCLFFGDKIVITFSAKVGSTPNFQCYLSYLCFIISLIFTFILARIAAKIWGCKLNRYKVHYLYGNSHIYGVKCVKFMRLLQVKKVLKLHTVPILTCPGFFISSQFWQFWHLNKINNRRSVLWMIQTQVARSG